MEMSTRRRIVCLGFMLLFVLAGSYEQPFLGQPGSEVIPQRVRVVGVITGPELNSSAPGDRGDDGLTRLSEIFVSYGATISAIPADQEIPPEIELVVLIRPQHVLSTAQTAHLWDFLQNGGHLLLALDPVGHNGSATESAKTSGINRLLQAEYGLSFVDNLLVEDWFGLENLGDVVSSWSDIQPEDLIPHVITSPLIQYGLPIRFWGGRSILVDALTGNAVANPLIYTESPYGETAPVNFQNGDGTQLRLNIGPDTQGRLVLGGIATNSVTGSRVAVIGDSEIFQNVFGQTWITGRETMPLYVGDYIFTQRLLAWLMAVPEAEYPGLPQGFTWIALNGEASDWPADISILADQQSDDPRYGMQQVRAFQNDKFVYLLLESQNPRTQGSIVYVFVEDSAGNHETINIDTHGSIRFRDKSVLDAAVAMDAAIEIRLPRRLFPNDDSVIAQICIAESSGSSVDCFDGPIRPVDTNGIDPLPVRFGVGPEAFTAFNNVNLRSEPSTSGKLIITLPFRTLFAVVGRNNAGDWVYVQNSVHEGWINLPLLQMNADVGILPNFEVMTVEGTE